MNIDLEIVHMDDENAMQIPKEYPYEVSIIYLDI